MSARRPAAGGPERPVLCAIDRPATDRLIRPFAEVAAAALGQEIRDIHASPLIAGGSAGPVIVDEAERVHASVIVMGSRALTDARALLAGGSVAHDVIHAAACPVLVVPLHGSHRAPEGGFRRVLAAIDGSAPAHRAASFAALLAAPGAEILVLHCREVERVVATAAGAALGGAGDGTWPLETPAEAETLAESFTRSLGERGFQVSNRVYSDEHGSVAHRIVAEAAAFNADLVAMGTRGRSEVASLLLGSVAHAVLAGAHRPLLVSR